MITLNKLLIIFIDILFIMILFMVPVEYFGTLCILFADLVVLTVVIQQIKAKLPDVLLFFFNITYFVFVLGGGTFTIFAGESLMNFTSASATGTNIASMIAFVGVLIIDSTYYLISKQSRKKLIENNSILRTFNAPSLLQKQTVVMVFILAFASKMAMALENMFYSQMFGYVSLYTREATNLPSIVVYIGSLFYFSFLLVLCCDFSKRATYLCLLSVAIIEIIILNSGDRGEAVCGIIIMLIYVINRTKKYPDFLVHKKTIITLAIIIIPLGIYLLQAIKYIRVGDEYSSRFGEGLSDFFISQGLSLNLIANGIDLKEEIEKLAGNTFVLGQFRGYLEQNVISRTLFGIQYIKSNTIAAAISGTSYGSAMAYLRFRPTYLQGVGCGTCFLVELFHDWSWVGVILGCLAIPFLFKNIEKYHNISWINNALCLNCIRVLLMLPRGSYFKWITDVFAIQNLMLLVLLWVILRIQRKQSSNK